MHSLECPFKCAASCVGDGVPARIERDIDLGHYRRISLSVEGASVLAYRGRHSAFPVRLEQAVTRAPDPFGTSSLKYRREGSGFVVYSIGPDGNFGGGQPGMRRDRNQAYFRYPVSSQRA